MWCITSFFSEGLNWQQVFFSVSDTVTNLIGKIFCCAFVNHEINWLKRIKIPIYMVWHNEGDAPSIIPSCVIRPFDLVKGWVATSSFLIILVWLKTGPYSSSADNLLCCINVPKCGWGNVWAWFGQARLRQSQGMVQARWGHSWGHYFNNS